MFENFLAGLRFLFWGKKEEPAPRLDEFHKATYQELFDAAWTIVAGKPPRRNFGYPDDGRVKVDELTQSYPVRGARIEFNAEGLGRVIPTDVASQIDISMDNLPVKVRWNPAKLRLHVTEAQNRRFAVHLMGSKTPASTGSTAAPVCVPTPISEVIL